MAHHKQKRQNSSQHRRPYRQRRQLAASFYSIDIFRVANERQDDDDGLLEREKGKRNVCVMAQRKPPSQRDDGVFGFPIERQRSL